MWAVLLSAIEAVIGFIWNKHVTLGEKAGAAEQKAKDEQADLDVLTAEQKAAVNTPTMKTAMEQLIEKHKL